jgi:hypothetical protein
MDNNELKVVKRLLMEAEQAIVEKDEQIYLLQQQLKLTKEIAEDKVSRSNKRASDAQWAADAANGLLRWGA